MGALGKGRAERRVRDGKRRQFAPWLSMSRDTSFVSVLPLARLSTSVLKGVSREALGVVFRDPGQWPVSATGGREPLSTSKPVTKTKAHLSPLFWLAKAPLLVARAGLAQPQVLFGWRPERACAIVMSCRNNPTMPPGPFTG